MSYAFFHALSVLTFPETPTMLYASLKTLHLLALIVWLGGMVFVHFFLRPALALWRRQCVCG
jgi:putative copper export protein